MPPKKQPKKKVAELQMEEGEMQEDEGMQVEVEVEVATTADKKKANKRKAVHQLIEYSNEEEVSQPEPPKGKKAMKAQKPKKGQSTESQEADKVEKNLPQSSSKGKMGKAKASVSTDDEQAGSPPQQTKGKKKNIKTPETVEVQDDEEPKGKKAKKAKKPEVPLTEAQKASKAGFAKFMRREKVQDVGSREIPIGKPNCLSGLKFVITGVLDGIGDRDAGSNIIKKYGGIVNTAISGKTNYLIVGREPGDSKVSKAAKLGVEQLDVDDFLNLIRVSTAKPNM